eukprot:4611613-Prymnesium_polylepis.1
MARAWRGQLAPGFHGARRHRARASQSSAGRTREEFAHDGRERVAWLSLRVDKLAHQQSVEQRDDDQNLRTSGA